MDDAKDSYEAEPLIYRPLNNDGCARHCKYNLSFNVLDECETAQIDRHQPNCPNPWHCTEPQKHNSENFQNTYQEFQHDLSPFAACFDALLIREAGLAKLLRHP